MLKFYIVPSAKEDQGFVMSSLLKKEKDQVLDILKRHALDVDTSIGMFPDNRPDIGIVLKCELGDVDKVQELVNKLDLINNIWIGPKTI